MEELERQLQCADSERQKLEAKAREHRGRISELETSQQKAQVDLTTQLEDTKMKVRSYQNLFSNGGLQTFSAYSCIVWSWREPSCSIL